MYSAGMKMTSCDAVEVQRIVSITLNSVHGDPGDLRTVHGVGQPQGKGRGG